MKKLLSLFLVFVLALNLIVTVSAQTEGKGLVWVVSDDDTTIYLLGTIHIGSEIIHPFSEQLTNIILGCDAVIFEVDMGDEEGLDYHYKNSFYSENDKLSNHISEELMKELNSIFTASPLLRLMLGITTVRELETVKPGSISSLLTYIAYIESERLRLAPGVDDTVYEMAVNAGIEIREIENFKFQVDLLGSFGDEYDEMDLWYAIESYYGQSAFARYQMETLYMMLRAWGDADLELFEFISAKDYYDDPVSIALAGDRDINMYRYVRNLLKEPGQYLVAVGAAHMVGEGGIVRRLEKAGYNVRFLYDKVYTAADALSILKAVANGDNSKGSTSDALEILQKVVGAA